MGQQTAQAKNVYSMNMRVQYFGIFATKILSKLHDPLDEYNYSCKYQHE